VEPPGGSRHRSIIDPTKRPGLNQQAPLTPEYQKILEASLADQAAGGGGGGPDYLCISSGMPMRMTAYNPLEFIITADTTLAAPAESSRPAMITIVRTAPFRAATEATI
jgi:hypothetical protein